MQFANAHKGMRKNVVILPRFFFQLFNAILNLVVEHRKLRSSSLWNFFFLTRCAALKQTKQQYCACWPIFENFFFAVICLNPYFKAELCLKSFWDTPKKKQRIQVKWKMNFAMHGRKEKLCSVFFTAKMSFVYKLASQQKRGKKWSFGCLSN